MHVVFDFNMFNSYSINMGVWPRVFHAESSTLYVTGTSAPLNWAEQH